MRSDDAGRFGCGSATAAPCQGLVASLGQVHFFAGNLLNAVDAKGRLSVPSFIRQILERRAGGPLMLRPHAEYPCLVGYDQAHGAEQFAKAERRLGEDPTTAAEMQVQAALAGSAIEVSCDPSGRIILPPRLKRRAQIDNLALFIGMVGDFQVWNPELALACDVAAIRDIAADAIEDRKLAG